MHRMSPKQSNHELFQKKFKNLTEDSTVTGFALQCGMQLIEFTTGAEQEFFLDSKREVQNILKNIAAVILQRLSKNKYSALKFLLMATFIFLFRM